MKKTPLKRKTSLVRRTWIKRLSPKRADEMRKYKKMRVVFLRLYPTCDVGVSAGCKMSEAAATEIHHCAGRRGKYLMQIESWRATCRACHNWIHANPNEARKLGFIIDPQP